MQNALLQWYAAHKRNLPWRQTHDPYKIWISEAMLQQTRVDQALPYYERFLKTFPTIQKLAKAPLGKVLKVWEGLGYYSRARHLHRAAKEIVKTHKGKVPDWYDGLSQLPGFGPYTTAAVLSIAYNKPYPVLDGNVIRVLSRLYLIETDAKKTETKKQLWEYARQLLPANRASDFNQAMMELGAMICVPQKPKCPVCPLNTDCKAFNGLKDPSVLPYSAPKKKIPHYDVVAGLIWNNDKLLIALRPEEGLLGGLWEFPGGKRKKNESLQNACLREIKEELGITVRVNEPFIKVNHAYSHFRITLHTFHCLYQNGTPKALGCTDWKWVTVNDLKKYAFPKANTKIIEAL